MEQNTCHFTVLFQDPFWIGLAERWEVGGYQVCRTVFGAEPTDAQLYQWLLRGWSGLAFSDPVPDGGPRPLGRNPKREQRQARRATQSQGVGTKAQQALSRQREQNAQQRQSTQRLEKQGQQEERFRLRQQKKREKRRGH